MQNNKYFQILSCPEKNKGVKIPSSAPVPSCSFQLHNSVFLPQTNSSGNLVFLFNPFFLATNDNTFNMNYNSIKYPDNFDTNKAKITGISRYITSSFIANNFNEVTGENSSNKFFIWDDGQCIEPIYDQYRLVSAAITVRYLGKMEEANGIIGGGIIFHKSNNIFPSYEIKFELENGRTGIGFTPPDLSEFKDFANFNNIRNSYYHQENMCLEGLRMLYFPLDNSYYEYNKVIDNQIIDLDLNIYTKEEDEYPFFVSARSKIDDNKNNGFYFAVYIHGSPANGRQNQYKMDYYCNFECLPKAQYLNCMPLSVNNEYLTQKEIKEAIVYIQKKPVFKYNNL